LSKVYRSGSAEVTVLDGLSLEVRRGERLAVVGESGTGKSTLLHLLGGLDHATGGRICFGDEEISSQTEDERARFRNREIGFMWQSPSLLPEFSAMENVMMPLLIRGGNAGEAGKRARFLLGEVGLADRCSHQTGELSGGEQQRVALARALCGEPRVLLADEPTGSLDFRTGEKIFDLLDEMHRAHELTSVIVTHNLVFASRCDRILELKKGGLHPHSGGGRQEAGSVKDATRLGGGTYV
jgi:lipoprotein-releasing system ATP-binding protein